jgi:hypothetical protein
MVASRVVRFLLEAATADTDRIHTAARTAVPIRFISSRSASINWGKSSRPKPQINLLPGINLVMAGVTRARIGSAARDKVNL